MELVHKGFKSHNWKAKTLVFSNLVLYKSSLNPTIGKLKPTLFTIGYVPLIIFKSHNWKAKTIFLSIDSDMKSALNPTIGKLKQPYLYLIEGGEQTLNPTIGKLKRCFL